MPSLLYPVRPTKDEQWFNSLLPHIDELYISLGIPHQQLQSLRQQYESAPFNPDLRPLHLDATEYQRKNDELRSLQKHIDDEETDTAVRQVYTLKIRELVTQNELLVASINDDQNELASLNRWLYGTTKPESFAGVCAWLRQTANEYYSSEVPYLSHAAAQVLECVPDLGGSVRTILPDDHIFKAVREAHFKPQGYIGQLFGDATIPDSLTPAAGDSLTQLAIQAVGSSYSLDDSTDSLWGVIHSQHSVVRPAGYLLQRAAFMGIVSHEIGSHLLERENGMRQQLRLLSAGLDRYEASNEGRAFLREQIMYHSPYELLGEFAWEHIMLLYLSSSLAAGAYRQPYDFTLLYDTILPVWRLLLARHTPDNPAITEANARDEAWQTCTRAAKGTSGTGGAFSKGLVYLNGNLDAWKMAAESPDYVFFGDAGKFDISRADHRQILADCGITPQSYAVLS